VVRLFVDERRAKSLTVIVSRVRRRSIVFNFRAFEQHTDVAFVQKKR